MRLLVGLKIFSKLNPLDLSIILVKYIQNVKAMYARENCIGLADSGTYFWPMHRCILDFCLFLGPHPPMAWKKSFTIITCTWHDHIYSYVIWVLSHVKIMWRWRSISHDLYLISDHVRQNHMSYHVNIYHVKINVRKSHVKVWIIRRKECVQHSHDLFVWDYSGVWFTAIDFVLM